MAPRKPSPESRDKSEDAGPVAESAMGRFQNLTSRLLKVKPEDLPAKPKLPPPA
jgi:hypothetical protein